jgi:hypothetical protein
MDNAPHIHVPSKGRYLLPKTTVPPGVRMEGEMLRNIDNLKFMDHDMTKQKQISELDRENYLCTRSIPDIGETLLETQ